MAETGFSLPKIDLTKSRIDQSSYWGRVRHFYGVIDPTTLFVSDTKLKQSLDLLEGYKKGILKSPVTEDQLWRAKQIKEAIIHPDTDEKVPLPFRMSAFVPVNIPLVAGMLASRSPAATIFWQWANQSYNVAVNYANRNASNEMPMKQVALGYAGAVASSCSLAIGLGKVTDRLTGPGSTIGTAGRIALKNLVPYTAVASAGAINVLLMRSNEITEGIQVKDKDGQVLGQSVVAGKNAIWETMLTRVFLPGPVLVLPGLAMGLLGRTSITRHPRLRMAAEMAIITGSLWLALPMAIGLFPQQSVLATKDLEPKFQNLKHADGSPVDYVFFNKGL